MRQLTYVGPNKVEWWDVSPPKLENDQDALVEPLAVSRCDLDLVICAGKSGMPGPFAIGHEAAGRVIAVGDAIKSFKPGDLVIVPFQISCGYCDRCLRGHTNACASVPFRSSYGMKPLSGTEYGGALSDLLRVPFAEHMLVKQPAGLALSQTAALADGATDGFVAVAQWLVARPGADVLVIGGAGQAVGMYAVQTALGLGAGRVVYLDNHPGRLEKAKTLGAETCAAPENLEMDPVGLFPIVIDAAATDASISLALRSVAHNGVCQRMYGDFTEKTPIELRHMYTMGLTLKVSRVNARAAMPECLDHVVAGRYHPEHVLTRQVPFEEAHEAILDPTVKLVFLREGVE